MKKNANGQPRDTQCSEGQSVFDAIRYGVSNGWYPVDALLGDSVTSLPKPAKAIAQVTVRQHESFWIIAPTGAYYDVETQRWVSN